MTQQEKNQRLCERAGWIGFFEPGDDEGTGSWTWHKGNKNVRRLPNLFTSLDAVHEVWCKLTKEQHLVFRVNLQRIVVRDGHTHGPCRSVCNATAAQRAEALGLTLGLWKEGE